MSIPLINKLSNNISNNKKNINIYYSKISDILINNTKRILNQDNINIKEDNSN